MPRKRSTKNSILKEVKLPEWMELIDQQGDYAIVKIRVDNIERVRLLKLSDDFRAYRREIQRKYRQRLKEKRKHKSESSKRS